MDEPVVWETVDRLGRVVRMTQPAWQHIVARHVELATRSHLVREAVANADSITQDRTFAHRDVHRREDQGGKPAIVVVVHYRPTPDGWIGYVVTAFHRSRPEKGWSRWP